MPNLSIGRGLLMALCLPAFTATASSAVDPRQTWQLLDARTSRVAARGAK